MKILVTGGAGFIGSVVTEQLVAEGHDVVVLDSLKYGFPAAVTPPARLVRGDILDGPALNELFRKEHFDAVAHLAAEAFIDDSVRDPGLFYRVNVCGGLELIEAMRHAGVKRLIFSSTAAVYGQPTVVPIPTDAPMVPCNPYGDSKLAFERILAWHHVAHGLRYICLRYFNACGATERCGESRKKETHLIPIALAAAMGARNGLDLFGADYDTPDGTCVRDYVHVADIARAHVLALAAVDRIEPTAFNLGNGEGYSNRQVIAAVQEATGRTFEVRDAPRRPGDPAVLVADATAARQQLGWKPAFPELRGMVETAWRWRERHPRGYE
ncbi:MAG: UDP-glucose 4-epimerase GalE [Thermoguttaceae bacterium]